MTVTNSQYLAIQKDREAFRDAYWRRRDPIAAKRLSWRAHILRHLVHLRPGQTIVEIGSGRGDFTRQMVGLSRGENPITAVHFCDACTDHDEALPNVRRVSARQWFAETPGHQACDFVVAHDMLDRNAHSWLLSHVFDVLRPGGQTIFFETNPWNPLLRLRRLLRIHDRRLLLDRVSLYELFSDIGFVRVFSWFNDFVYAPRLSLLVGLMGRLSVFMENSRWLQRYAATIVVHAQKPPRNAPPFYCDLAHHQRFAGKVSFVIPCYNEEMNVRPLVEAIRGFYDRYIHDIVLVDDNSVDGTRDVIMELSRTDPRIKLVARKPPGGVGRAPREGLEAAAGQYVLSLDCDFQHLLPEFRGLFDAMADGVDVAVGSRFSRESVLLNYPFKKIVANRCFHLLFNLLFWNRHRDLTNNLKLMKREVVEHLDLESPHFSVNAETGLKPVLMGYRVREVPISWINRSSDMGVSSFKIAKVGGGYARVLGKLLLNYHALSPFRRSKVRC